MTHSNQIGSPNFDIFVDPPMPESIRPLVEEHGVSAVLKAMPELERLRFLARHQRELTMAGDALAMAMAAQDDLAARLSQLRLDDPHRSPQENAERFDQFLQDNATVSEIVGTASQRSIQASLAYRENLVSYIDRSGLTSRVALRLNPHYSMTETEAARLQGPGAARHRDRRGRNDGDSRPPLRELPHSRGRAPRQ